MDPYAVLGVEVSASQAEIAQAFRKKCLVLHPDKNADAKSTEQFQLLSSAYERLKDPKQRAVLDTLRCLQPILSRLGVKPAAVSELAISRLRQGLQQPEGTIEEVILEEPIAKQLEPKLCLMERQCQAAFFPIEVDLPGQAAILVCGTPTTIQRGKGIIDDFRKQVLGLSAPAGGLIFVVPADLVSRIHVMEPNFVKLQQKLGAQLTKLPSGRIKVTGSNQPEVVGQLLRWLGHRGQILLDIPGSGDCELDVWMYQHYCEVSKIPFTIGGLVPADKTPDRPTVMRLLLFALNMGSTSEFTGLISLCVKVLKQNLLTETLIRAMNSDAVFQEYSLLSPAEKAPLLCALASMQSLRQRAIRYASEPLINTLQSLRDFLQRIDGVFLRSNGLIAAKEAVPSDSQWHGWSEVLQSTSLQSHWALLVQCAPCFGGAPLPNEWYLAEVMEMLLQGDETVEVSLLQGIKTREAAEVTGDRNETKRTLVEKVEDWIHEKSKQHPTLYGESVVQLAPTQLRLEPGIVSRIFFEQHQQSFQVTESGQWRVQLNKAGKERAERRAMQKANRNQSALLLRVARLASKQQQLNQLLTLDPEDQLNQLPSTFSTRELCGLFISLSETQSHSQLAATILRHLSRRDLEKLKLTEQMVPFHVAQLMQGVISYQKSLESKTKLFCQDSLMMLMNAASDDIMLAPLDIANDYLFKAHETPFFGLNWRDQPMLLVSAARRIMKELTPESGNTCPACFSSSYSAFPHFANLCQSLSSLYSHASSHLVLDHKEEVANAFTVLAAGLLHCKSMSDMSTQSPAALKRLIIAFTTLSKIEPPDEKLHAAATAGRCHLRPVVLETLASKVKPKDHKEHWDAWKLFTIVSAYDSAGDRLYDLVSEVAERLARKLDERDSLKDQLPTWWDIIRIFIGEGSLSRLQEVLKILLKRKAIDQRVVEVTKALSAPWRKPQEMDSKVQEVVHLLAAWICTDDPEALQKATSYIKTIEIAMPHWILILNNVGKSDVKKLLLDKVLSACKTQVPTVKDLHRLVHACHGDPDYISQLQQTVAGRTWLDSVPVEHEEFQDLLKTLEHFLGPFASTEILIPRLEAACAGRLMKWLAKGQSSNPHKVIKAGLLFRTAAFTAMPSLAWTLRMCLTSQADETAEFKTLFDRMDESSRKVIEISPRDQCLDKWTEKLDEAVLACGMPEMHLDKVEMSLATRSELLKELQDALGQSWLSILLARSKRLSWTGGGTIHIPVGPELSDPDRRERSRSRSRHSGSSSSCELMRDAEDADADAPKRKVQKMAASAASATASASAAAASPGDDAERSAQTEEELREWLRAADYTGKGILQKYEEKLVQEMEGKKSNLLVFVNESEEKSALARIDKLFWDTIACHQTGHKLVIAKAMKKLYEENVENP